MLVRVGTGSIPYLVVRVFPEVQRDELEGVQHSPWEIVKVCEPPVRIIAHLEACVTGLTRPTSRNRWHQ